MQWALDRASGLDDGSRHSAPRFSLILATLGRIDEPGAFLESLARQTYRSLELIVVDQNEDDRLRPVLERFSDSILIRRVKCGRGVSRARNLGLGLVTGDIVGFPDDDCVYPSGLLQRVAAFFDARPDAHGLSGRAVDMDGREYARFDRAPGRIDLHNVWRRTVTFTLFLRAEVSRDLGGFDETLGPGAGTPWAAAEDIDYPLRAAKLGYLIEYDPSIVVMHPNPLSEGYEIACDRAYRYGLGIGRVWRKHGFPIWLVAYYLLRPLGGAALRVMQNRPGEARYHWNAFCGRLKGWAASLE